MRYGVSPSIDLVFVICLRQFRLLVMTDFGLYLLIILSSFTGSLRLHVHMYCQSLGLTAAIGAEFSPHVSLTCATTALPDFI